MSLPLSKLFGGAFYLSTSADFAFTQNMRKVIVAVFGAGGKKIILPDENQFPYTEAPKYYILNTGGNAVDLTYKNPSSITYNSAVVTGADHSIAGFSAGLMPPGGQIVTSGFSNGANNGTFTVAKRQCDAGKVFFTAGLANETVNVIFPSTPTATLTQGRIAQIAAGNVAFVTLAYNPGRNTREWFVQQRAYGSAQTYSTKRSDGAAHASICTTVINPPPPPPPPPPYIGGIPDTSGSASSYGVTLAGFGNLAGIAPGCFNLNGVYRVTKQTIGGITFWRKILTPTSVYGGGAYIDLYPYPPGNGYGYVWQVIVHAPGVHISVSDPSLKGNCNRRFGNNSVGTSPPFGSYACFAVPSDPATCSFSFGGTATCTVAA